MRKRARRHNALRLGSVALTIGAFVAYPMLPDRQLHLTGNPAVAVTGFSDKLELGGNSQFSVTAGPTPTLYCDVQSGSDVRYCGLSLEPFRHNVNYGDLPPIQFKAAQKRVLDLRGYSHLTVQLQYEGVRDFVNLTLLGRSDIQDLNGHERQVLRHMDVLLHRRELNGAPLKVYLNQFQTAQWWLAEYDIPRLYAAPDLSQITGLVVGLTDSPPTGKSRIVIKQLTLHRPLIAKNIFYIVIALYWLAFILAEGFFHFMRVFRQREETNLILNALRKDYNDLSQTAGRDPLTGVFNRLSFNRLRQSFFERDLDSAYVMVIDLDHFKRINDQQGHQFGDLVLKEAAQSMQSLVRSKDLLVRWGGEEFVLLAANLSHSEALALGERLRETISRLQFEGYFVNVSASIGVSHIRTGESFSDAFERADKALYAAKKAGRDQVVYRPAEELVT